MSRVIKLRPIDQRGKLRLVFTFLESEKKTKKNMQYGLYVAHKAQNIDSLAPYRKCFPLPGQYNNTCDRREMTRD